MPPSTAVATRESQESPLALVQQTLKEQGGALRAFLPHDEHRQRFLRIVMKAVQDNPGLLECTPESVAEAAVEAAQLGLEPSGHIGGAHLVPFRENVGTRDAPRWIKKAQLVTDYRGDIDLARRSEKVEDAYAEVVRASDRFEYDAAQATVTAHVPDLTASRSNNPDDEANPITHGYGCVVHRSGYRRFVVMTKEEIEAIRQKAPGRNSPAWREHWPEMAKKTLLKRALKTAPLPPALKAVISREDDLTYREPVHATVEAPARGQSIAHRLAQQREAAQLTGGNEQPQEAPLAAATAAESPAMESDAVASVAASDEKPAADVGGAGSAASPTDVDVAAEAFWRAAVDRKLPGVAGEWDADWAVLNELAAKALELRDVGDTDALEAADWIALRERVEAGEFDAPAPRRRSSAKK